MSHSMPTDQGVPTSPSPILIKFGTDNGLPFMRNKCNFEHCRSNTLPEMAPT